MKKLILLLFSIVLLGCSYIDKMTLPNILSVETEMTEGGFFVYFYTNNILTETIFLSNGIDGLNGINGIDGASVSITTAEGDGGTWLYIQQGDIIITEFIPNGTNGIDGLNGLNGTSTNITTEQGEGGYWLIFLEEGTEINRIFILDGVDGSNGTNGTNGDTINIINIEGGIMITVTKNDGSYEVYYVYNGINGTNGTNGLNSITTVTQQEDCIVINSGLDIDGDFILDANEILYSELLCGCSLEPCDDDCDEDNPKVEICHQRVIGSVPQYFTIYVPQSAVQAHLGHGDNLGECLD